MIICMNYSDDGERFIARIEYSLYAVNVMAIAQSYSEMYDEVYMIPFVATKDLINEVVLKGCRI